MLPFKNPNFYNHEGTKGWAFFLQLCIALLIVWISMFMGFHTSYHSSGKNTVIPKSMIANATTDKKIATFNHNLANVAVDKDYLPSLDQYINIHNKPKFIYKSFNQVTTQNLLLQTVQMSAKKKVDQAQFKTAIAPLAQQISDESLQNLSGLHYLPDNEKNDYKNNLIKLINDNSYKSYSSHYQPLSFKSGHKTSLSFKFLIGLTIVLIITTILIVNNKLYTLERLAEVTSFSSIAAMATIFINIHFYICNNFIFYFVKTSKFHFTTGIRTKFSLAACLIILF